MRVVMLVAGFLACVTAAASPTGQRNAARTIRITSTDDMKFSVTSIAARPGERLRVVLVATGSMPATLMAHNWILLRAGTDSEAFVNAGVLARSTNFIAASQMDRVLASTPLVAAGETAEVTFTAPATRGEYPYVCSFRGHYLAGMWGTLLVK